MPLYAVCGERYRRARLRCSCAELQVVDFSGLRVDDHSARVLDGFLHATGAGNVLLVSSMCAVGADHRTHGQYGEGGKGLCQRGRPPLRHGSHIRQGKAITLHPKRNDTSDTVQIIYRSLMIRDGLKHEPDDVIDLTTGERVGLPAAEVPCALPAPNTVSSTNRRSCAATRGDRGGDSGLLARKVLVAAA